MLAICYKNFCQRRYPLMLILLVLCFFTKSASCSRFEYCILRRWTSQNFNLIANVIASDDHEHCDL